MISLPLAPIRKGSNIITYLDHFFVDVGPPTVCGMIGKQDKSAKKEPWIESIVLNL